MASFSQRNIDSILVSLEKHGITNKYLQAGILATVAKETGIRLVPENLNYTSPSRLMQVWPQLFPTTQSAIPYTNNPEKLGNLVYGGKFGNSATEGYRYRARGYNGLTFKSNYQLYGNKIGIDLVKNPDRANDPDIAADLLSVYYVDFLKKSSCSVSKYSPTGSSQINDLETGVRVAVAVTAGCPASFGNLLREDISDAMAVAPQLYAIVKQSSPVRGTLRTIVANPKIPLAVAATIVIVLIVLLIWKRDDIVSALT